MSKEMSIILLGVWVVIVPYLGVPESWRTLLLVLSGIAVVVIGLLLRGETLSRGVGENINHPFVEHVHKPDATAVVEETTFIEE